MRKQSIFLNVPLAGLLVSFLVLYANDLFGVDIPVVSKLNFLEKTSLFAAFAFAAFAAVESVSTLNHAAFETRRYRIEDARNELEKAYGPLYSLLNKASARGNEPKNFWLEYEERKKIDEILATYPFMFSPRINKLWQDKIRNLDSMIETSALNAGKVKINLDAYADLRNIVNEEYARKVRQYHALLGKKNN
jgi:hypothetical protein